MLCEKTLVYIPNIRIAATLRLPRAPSVLLKGLRGLGDGPTESVATFQSQVDSSGNPPTSDEVQWYDVAGQWTSAVADFQQWYSQILAAQNANVIPLASQNDANSLISSASPILNTIASIGPQVQSGLDTLESAFQSAALWVSDTATSVADDVSDADAAAASWSADVATDVTGLFGFARFGRLRGLGQFQLIAVATVAGAVVVINNWVQNAENFSNKVNLQKLLVSQGVSPTAAANTANADTPSGDGSGTGIFSSIETVLGLGIAAGAVWFLVTKFGK